MEATTFHAIVTVVSILGFLALVAWTWSGKRKAHYQDAARMPLDDDPLPTVNSRSKENRDG